MKIQDHEQEFAIETLLDFKDFFLTIGEPIVSELLLDCVWEYRRSIISKKAEISASK